MRPSQFRDEIEMTFRAVMTRSIFIIFALCSVLGANGLVEEIAESGQQTSIKGYIDLVRPAISSLCNFASQDGVASDECKACTDSLKLLIDHLFEQRTWAIMSKLFSGYVVVFV